MTCVRGGYKTLSPIQICNVLGALQDGLITFRAMRVFFACASALASREAALRVCARLRVRRGVPQPRYEVDEIARLTRCTSIRVVRRELKRLEAVGLLRFSTGSLVLADLPIESADVLLARTSGGRSPTRAIPVPRPVLRLLARPGAASTAKVLLAYCIRGLSFDRRTEGVRGCGTVKASWIADAFDMSLRSVRSGRAELVKLGVVRRDTGSSQWKLNRDGSYFSWNLSWAGASCSAPPWPRSASDPAPPMERPETPYGSKKDQERVEPGVSKGPDIREVTPTDLTRLGRLEKLFAQAVRRGLIAGTDSDALNFVAAAVRAIAANDASPERVFMGIVRKKLWHHVTLAQEERARAALARYRESRPHAFRAPPLVASGSLRRQESTRVAVDPTAIDALVKRSLRLAA